MNELLHNLILIELVKKNLAKTRRDGITLVKSNPLIIQQLTIAWDLFEALPEMGFTVLEDESGITDRTYSFSKEFSLMAKDAAIAAYAHNFEISHIITNDKDFERVPWLTTWKPWTGFLSHLWLSLDHYTPSNPSQNALIYRPHAIPLPESLAISRASVGVGDVEYGNNTIFAIIMSQGRTLYQMDLLILYIRVDRIEYSTANLRFTPVFVSSWMILKILGRLAFWATWAWWICVLDTGTRSYYPTESS